MNKRQRREFYYKMRYYQPAARFMSGGGLYGRSRYCPLVAGHTQRIFRTCIHLSWKNFIWFSTSQNANAFNKQALVPLFAYQIRPVRHHHVPPPSRESLPVEDSTFDWEWREAA